MTTAYVVTAGQYSDYHIVAVFLDKDKAETFVEWHNKRQAYEQCGIEEYAADVYTDLAVSGKELFCVYWTEPLDEMRVRQSASLPDQADLDGNIHDTSRFHGHWYTYVLADNEQHAAKIATERRSMWLVTR